MSPTNSTRTGSASVAGKDIDDAPTDCEGAMLVDRILAREPTLDEQVRKSLGLDLGADSRAPQRRPASAQAELVRGSSAAAEATMMRADAGDGAVQRTRPCRRNSEVRGHPPIGIDLEPRQREDGLVDRGVRCAFKATVEEADVRRQPLGFRICRRDDHSHARSAPRKTGNRERL